MYTNAMLLLNYFVYLDSIGNVSSENDKTLNIDSEPMT